MTYLTSNSGPVRINKYLSECGICSRREADRLIEAGAVTIDGAVALTGQKVLPGQTVICRGVQAVPTGKFILLALNKPAGIECTAASDNPDNIVDFVGYPERVFPIGRLDKNSTGLILLTNAGDLVNPILRARSFHEKEYEVTVDRPVSDAVLRRFAAGVDIGDAVTRPCRVTRTGPDSCRVILTQGLNRQIRRMFEALGFKVIALNRIRIMNILLGDLPQGKYREVTDEEKAELFRLIGRK